MKKTATGCVHVVEGEARGWRASITTVVGVLLGTVPRWLPARLEAVTRLSQLEKILRGAVQIKTLSELEALITPARPDRRRLSSGLERLMKETATGRALFAEGFAKGYAKREAITSITTVVEVRLGAVPAWLPARLETITRLSPLEKLLRGVLHVESLSDLEALLPPARRSRRRAQ